MTLSKEARPVSEANEGAGQMVHWSGMTHRGRVRANNEDAFLALTFDATGVRYLGKIGEASLGGADFVFAVSDGMGGAQSGEYASRIAVEKITKLLPRSFHLSAQHLASGFQDILAEVFHGIHEEMTRLSRCYEECRGMGATLSMAWFSPGWMYFGHIGDSRIYYLPKAGGIRQVTNDDSHVGWLRRQGKINEREQRTHPRKNVLQKALGADHQFVEPQVGAVGWEKGDRFLLCTDGLIDGLWDHSLDEVLRQPGSKMSAVPAQRLVEEALDASGRDNITAVVVEVGGDV
ncbi:serine/threonine-protein phosphatase [Phragmitibacter flavus]|uniref:Serine/threonine-protein phosphatase n=1 Tax=Phragmitibacter flavus TaxID=2576071 RepID=A0A5R8KEM3_9BACT|nr:protein phosphatase 2C domain-containing protein [Phragmitibacter flavus]TLD70740.1 serine/threonine-protein phosphatase [Phragmitibacter flavus]